MSHGDAEIIVVTKLGYSIRFSEKDVRPMGRVASGVKAITLRDEDEAVSMDIVVEDQDVLVVSEYGYGKRTNVSEYTTQNRGGKGIKTYKITEKTGNVIAGRVCKDEDELMLINTSGIAIRINVREISVTSRSAMGVRLMRTNEDERIVAVGKINISEDETNEEISREFENKKLELTSDDTTIDDNEE